MDILTAIIALAMGVVLFLVLLLLASLVERTSPAESVGRVVSGSARSSSAG